MTDSLSIRILIVDDHAVVREGLSSLIRIKADMEVVGEAADGLEAVEQARTLRLVEPRFEKPEGSSVPASS